MVPKKARVLREGFRGRGYRAAASPFFSVKWKNNLLEVNRIGVIVGKSVDKRATRRNFLERQAKAQLLRLPCIGKDIIATVFPKANTLTKQEFVREFKKSISSLT